VRLRAQPAILHYKAQTCGLIASALRGSGTFDGPEYFCLEKEEVEARHKLNPNFSIPAYIRSRGGRAHTRETPAF
jgi:hypothetical protein